MVFTCAPASAGMLYKLPTIFASVDAIGSTTLITRDNAQVVEKRAYDVFGRRRNPDWTSVDVYGQIAAAQLDRGYTSHVEDFEMDTVHMRGRTYDARLARFTSADPVSDAANATQRWNRYAYVSNNPLKYTDPSGFTYIADPPQAPQQNETTGSPQQVVTVYQAPGEDDDNEDEDGDAEVSDQAPDPSKPPSNEAHGGGQSNGTSSGKRDGGGAGDGKKGMDRAERARAHDRAQREMNKKAASDYKLASERRVLDGRGGPQSQTLSGRTITVELRPTALTPSRPSRWYNESEYDPVNQRLEQRRLLRLLVEEKVSFLESLRRAMLRDWDRADDIRKQYWDEVKKLEQLRQEQTELPPMDLDPSVPYDDSEYPQ